MSESSPKEYFRNKRRYVQVGHLGRGGMAVVSESRDEYFQRNVAFKTLKDGPNRTKRETEFIREAMIMAKLEHPGVVPIHELIMEEKELPSITMGKVAGLSLQEKIKKHKADPASWPLKERLQFFLKFVEIVAYSHSRGVLHRDIKPGNVMIGEVGEVILLDWGLAKVMDNKEEEEEEDPTISRIDDSVLMSMESMSGSIKGTPYYMSPESAKGRTEFVNEQSDVFSLGAVLYELMTFEFFIKGTKAMEVLGNASASHTNSLAYDDLNSKLKADVRKVPPEIAFILKKSLEPERLFRYKTAKELQRDLIAYFNDKPIKGFGDGVGFYWVKKWFNRNGLALLLLTIPILITFYLGQILHEKYNGVQAQVLYQKDEIKRRKEEKKQTEIEWAKLKKRNEGLGNSKMEKTDDIESYELDELIIDEKLTTLKAETLKAKDDLAENKEEGSQLRKDIQNLDEQVFELESTYTSLVQQKEQKIKKDQYAAYMKVTPEIGAEFQFLTQVIQRGKILNSLDYIQAKDFFNQDPFAIHWFTYLLTKQVGKVQSIDLPNELEEISAFEGGPQYLANAENLLERISLSNERRLESIYAQDEWVYQALLKDRHLYFAKSGRVVSFDLKERKFYPHHVHEKTPVELAKADNGFYYGRYTSEQLFYQKSLNHKPKLLFHREPVLSFNWNEGGLILEDDEGLWNYFYEKPDYLESGWVKTKAPKVTEVEVSFDINPNEDEKYDDIIPPGYKVINSNMPLGPWLMVFNGFPKSKFRNLDPTTGAKEPLWQIDQLKVQQSLSDGYGGWLILSQEGELYSLKPGLAVKPLVPLQAKIKKIFPIIEWNISIAQDERGGGIYVHYLSTGQFLFRAGQFPPIDSVHPNSKERSLTFVLENGESIMLDL